ncbi:heparinase II/III family protein [Janthinobacterium psychrotolerans]|uniref:Heparinase II/III n=1 Tax=Janthinobacterium psychrotolerans TaxID=1747903 RepID=A0A1A7C6J2_9BURK|nr:alginate lyase family protein [Janthinobacterium psychrotolerans]OBV40654.1 Heparinase II/III [Janthinobacterium psychrotolerans]
MLANLTWKLNRLRAMGAPEVAHRVGDAVRQRLQARGIGLALTPPPASLARFGQPWLGLPVDSAPHLAAAERILAGRFDVFALRDAELGFPPEWNRDPKTGTLAPVTFGKTLNYRDEAVVGDIKCLWEPNRHLMISDLAMAYRLSGEMKHAQGVQTLLESWWRQCPYPLGANWSSALELALRLVSWSHAWQLLGGLDSALFQGAGGQAFLQRWLASIYQHCHFIAGHLSRHSSANNHLFGELTGLHVAALTWPCWPESADWLERTERELEQQALLQNGPDGVNREQAIYYQHTVADEMLLCLLAGRANGRPRSSAFLQRLESMLEFVAAMMNVAGGVPMIGDADDAQLANWDKAPGANAYRSLLASGAALFARGDFKRKAVVFDDKSAWLLGDAGRQAFDALPSVAATTLPRSFADGGYYIMGARFDTASEVRLTGDAGPLGYLGIAAHGHADALALTLSVAGQAVLVDPGTYAYHTQKQWRDYFRGTSAHNCVRIDGQDQSVSGGNFLWLRKARASCLAWRDDGQGQFWSASHDGYMALPDPLSHRREVSVTHDAACIVVEDILECQGTHDVELFWHLDPQCQLRLDGTVLHVQGAAFSLEMHLPDLPGATMALVCGAEQPVLGWISHRFDEKQAAPTLAWRARLGGGSRLRTTLHLTVSDL